MFRKILIANRGEIALRVIRACNELGIGTVAVYSEADKDSLHVQMADEAYCIGPAPSIRSYLNIPNIISVADISGAEAIHPGFGFLSENAKFAEICRDHGIKFIGPSPEAIRAMGDKNTAKQTAIDAAVPVIPGSGGLIENVEHAMETAQKIKFPVIIKATAGGGGKGMRVVQNEHELKDMLERAQAEAGAAFGNTGVYMEKYLEEPRHIEIQIVADQAGNIVHLGERDCSIQRRHQKLLEEAPSPAVSPKLREKMGESAVKLATAVNYEGVGTIEFLLDKDHNFYFMEMNTRLQVEHGVTEILTSTDLVKEQICIAAGQKLSFSQKDVKFHGHVIECRVNAEDPDKNFMPSAGNIIAYMPPGGPGVRVDSHVYPGYTIPPYYDSMVAKLMVWGRDRSEAIARMERALNEYAITGIKTTIPFHLTILNNAFFRRGDVYTNFIQRRILGDNE